MKAPGGDDDGREATPDHPIGGYRRLDPRLWQTVPRYESILEPISRMFPVNVIWIHVNGCPWRLKHLDSDDIYTHLHVSRASGILLFSSPPLFHPPS